MTKTTSTANQSARRTTQSNEAADWLTISGHEGQLSLDIYQTEKNLIVKSTIAGARPEEIQISLKNDLLTIRGKRDLPEDIAEADFLFRECYWGPFSRSIILPVDVQADKIKATMDNGVLTIVLPKAPQAKQIVIKVKS
ncbi:MAG TPA: Hsp20/alpha crystallin family protein [bacterium]|jgi:HSP20 family protein|nr:Hsp20/alpha crystallin family protein [bacterium]HNZ51420.1 Hsp20/alpha crystallin family protein [bacterium]HOF79399.1 Hsp20/alpha crystallin family protein [bacterium]HOH85577.1 Hsp20/alpha crystallin family protein [bacterium]HOQ91478.1 Hsp20/alpha crystallin family protein [bacterium]